MIKNRDSDSDEDNTSDLEMKVFPITRRPSKNENNGDMNKSVIFDREIIPNNGHNHNHDQDENKIDINHDGNQSNNHNPKHYRSQTVIVKDISIDMDHIDSISRTMCYSLFLWNISFKQFQKARETAQSPANDEIWKTMVNIQNSDSDEDNTSDLEVKVFPITRRPSNNGDINKSVSFNREIIPNNGHNHDQDENKIDIDHDTNQSNNNDHQPMHYRSQTVIVKDISIDMDHIDSNEDQDEIEEEEELKLDNGDNGVLDIRNTALAVMDVTSMDMNMMGSLDEDNTKLEAILAGMRSIDSEQSVRTPLTSDQDLSHNHSHRPTHFGYAEDSMYALQEGHEQSIIMSHNRMHSQNISMPSIDIDRQDSDRDVNLSINMDMINRNTSIIL
eukprot:CAMPEP_0201592866 /NCGR_PEP_ID=MMETSP0190_2-20130828/190635_1 /ASSEMBLY_ACC=CAM_ASM_000263 /TAXON_ID=37353 /ORGANISM="Rosalina sp." /LENGTH=387 /DNA_ID=CAMNT_0048051815 /DNA_START=296 /DNA_END=1460 /DNA_ORIENTATION=-